MSICQNATSIGSASDTVNVPTSRPPYDGAKDYFYINDVDDRYYLATLIKATISALPKPKKNPMLERKVSLR